MTPRFVSPKFEPTGQYDILIKTHNSAKVEYIKTVKGHQLNRIMDTLEEKDYDKDFDIFGRKNIARSSKP